MTNIYQLIDRIKKRPGMYLGKPSIIRLKSFLDGYMGARQDLGFPLTEQEEKFNYFLDQFFELFDQFIKIENSWLNSEVKEQLTI